MGQYKVPQNVESEDKILGPLTLKQFIYVIIGLGWAMLCFFIFSAVPVVMVALAAPVTIIFLLLGFYQRDGQNFEQYLVALVGFFSQNRKRVWRKEPISETFIVEAKKPVVEHSQRSPQEVRSQLEKLANIVDARGWAEEHDSEGTLVADASPAAYDTTDRLVAPSNVTPNGGLQQPGTETDIMDLSHSPLAQNLESLIDQAALDVRKEAMDKMRQGSASSQAEAARAIISGGPQPIPSVPPIGAPPLPAPAVAKSISVTQQPSGDILELATERDDLTVSQIAAQAMRNVPLQEGEAVKLSGQNNG